MTAKPSSRTSRGARRRPREASATSSTRLTQLVRTHTDTGPPTGRSLKSSQVPGQYCVAVASFNGRRAPLNASTATGLARRRGDRDVSATSGRRSTLRASVAAHRLIGVCNFWEVSSGGGIRGETRSASRCLRFRRAAAGRSNRSRCPWAGSKKYRHTSSCWGCRGLRAVPRPTRAAPAAPPGTGA